MTMSSIAGNIAYVFKTLNLTLNEDGNSVMNNIEQCYYDMGVGNPTVNSQLTFSCTKIETL